jgi:hypothetical protein
MCWNARNCRPLDVGGVKKRKTHLPVIDMLTPTRISSR